MKSLYDWFKKRWRASQSVTGEAPSYPAPQLRGRLVGGMREADDLRLLMSMRSWL